VQFISTITKNEQQCPKISISHWQVERRYKENEHRSKKRGFGRRRKLKFGSYPLDNMLITTSKAADSEQTHDESFEGFKALHNSNSVDKGD
jgi:hypothetical protein